MDPKYIEVWTRVHVAFGKGRQQTWYLGEVQNDEGDVVVRFGDGHQYPAVRCKVFHLDH